MKQLLWNLFLYMATAAISMVFYWIDLDVDSRFNLIAFVLTPLAVLGVLRLLRGESNEFSARNFHLDNFLTNTAAAFICAFIITYFLQEYFK